LRLLVDVVIRRHFFFNQSVSLQRRACHQCLYRCARAKALQGITPRSLLPHGSRPEGREASASSARWQKASIERSSSSVIRRCSTVRCCLPACSSVRAFLILSSLFIYLQAVCAGYCKCSRRWNHAAGSPAGIWIWRAQRTEACCEFCAVRGIWILLLQSASLLDSDR
jgi:hypothetical protein